MSQTPQRLRFRPWFTHSNFTHSSPTGPPTSFCSLAEFLIQATTYLGNLEISLPTRVGVMQCVHACKRDDINPGPAGRASFF
jgi:hypothetical protein